MPEGKWIFYVIPRPKENSWKLLSAAFRQEEERCRSSVLDHLCQVLSALSYAHQHGVIRRDVTPANIFIDDKRSL